MSHIIRFREAITKTMYNLVGKKSDKGKAPVTCRIISWPVNSCRSLNHPLTREINQTAQTHWGSV